MRRLCIHPLRRRQDAEKNTNQCTTLQSSRFKMSLKRLIPLLDRVLVRFDLNLFHFSRSKSTHHVQVERLTAKTQIGGMCAPFPPPRSACRRWTSLTTRIVQLHPRSCAKQIERRSEIALLAPAPPRPNSSPNQVVISTGPGARDRDGWLLLATNNSFMFLSWDVSLLG
jgi:hypothetical protein